MLAKWYKSCVKYDSYDRWLAKWPILASLIFDYYNRWLVQRET